MILKDPVTNSKSSKASSSELLSVIRLQQCQQRQSLNLYSQPSGILFDWHGCYTFLVFEIGSIEMGIQIAYLSIQITIDPRFKLNDPNRRSN